MNEKPWYKSRTVWLNAITFALTGGLAAAELLLPSMKGVVSPVVYALIAVALAAANAFLRFITTQSIK